MITIEWLATCDLCPWTLSAYTEAGAMGALILHDRLVHLETASGRAIPFVVDTRTNEERWHDAFMDAFNSVTEPRKDI